MRGEKQTLPMCKETPGAQAVTTKEYALKLPRLPRRAQQNTPHRTNPSPTCDVAAPALLAACSAVSLWLHAYCCADRSLNQRRSLRSQHQCRKHGLRAGTVKILDSRTSSKLMPTSMLDVTSSRSSSTGRGGRGGTAPPAGRIEELALDVLWGWYCSLAATAATCF